MKSDYKVLRDSFIRPRCIPQMFCRLLIFCQPRYSAGEWETASWNLKELNCQLKTISRILKGNMLCPYPSLLSRFLLDPVHIAPVCLAVLAIVSNDTLEALVLVGDSSNVAGVFPRLLLVIVGFVVREHWIFVEGSGAASSAVGSDQLWDLRVSRLVVEFVWVAGLSSVSWAWCVGQLSGDGLYSDSVV